MDSYTDESREASTAPGGHPQGLHNLSAEQGVLGALLFDNSNWTRLKDRLGADHFFDPVHQRIFSSIGTLIEQGRTADAVTLREWALGDSGLGEIGGAAYLVTLLENAATMDEAVLDYADHIRDFAERRSIVEMCRDTIKLAQTPPLGADAEDVLDETMRSIQRFADSRIGARGAWRSVRHAGGEIVKALRSPTPPGVKTGLTKLDRLLGGALYAPDLVIVAGRPAMGKTSFADNIAANVAYSGAVVGFFSMEMAPDQIAARMVSRRSAGMGAGFPYSRLRDRESRPDADYVEGLVGGLPDTLIIDPTGAQSVAGVRAAARGMRRQKRRLDLIILDYLQLMRDAQARRDGRVQEVSQITADLKALSKELGVPIIALSQLSRAVEARQDKRPQLSDLRESGTIEQDADIVLFVYREHYYLERSEPQAREGESRDDFAKRQGEHARRLRETRNRCEVATGKNRHAAGGVEQFYCDLSMDVIMDFPPDEFSVPRAPYRVED
jgi:replicative DNA helicase